MNRIILIGNGFDLAHGLKTSYKDFIDWIIISKFMIFNRNKGVLNDEDLELINNDFWFYEDIMAFKKNLCTDNTLSENKKNKSNEKEIFKNSFLKKIIINTYVNNWCDIETIFYDELNLLLNNEKTTDKEIKKFNSDFQRIINLLEEYLLIVVKSDNSIEKDIQTRILSLLYNNPVSQNDVSIEFKNSKETRILGIEKQLTLNKILILDFNYTKTISKYFTDSKTGEIMNSIEYINIHGTLNDQSNPIIFGFGDEKDEQYTKIEKSRLKGALKFIKSINYLNTSNYRNMLDFLELDYYQVYTWGHSCGLTDRTLLNHIFEHNRCVSIKPFYHEWLDKNTDNIENDYVNIVSNIARNFSDKNKLRDRVVDFSRCEQLIK